MTKTLTLPTKTLSVAFVGASAFDLPQRLLDESPDEADGYIVVLPSITLDHIRDRGDDIFQKYFDDDDGDDEAAFIEGLLADEDLFGALVDEFKESDSYAEWSDSYEPIMSFYWPVEMAYGVDPQRAADLIDEHARVCTLIALGGNKYGIALSGGGMNLSDKLAAAYLCCGVVPPQELLSGLRGVIDSHYLTQIEDGLKEAYSRAAEYLRARADRLDEVAGQLFEEPALADA